MDSGRKKMTLKKKMALGGIAPALIIVALGIVSFQSIAALLSVNQKIDQTNLIIKHVNGVQNAISGMETAHKNFLITGNKKYLDDFSRIKSSLISLVDELKGKIAQTRADRLIPLETLLNNWFKAAEAEVVLRKKIDMTPEQREAFRKDSGQALNLKVKDIIDPEILRNVQKLYDGATGVSNLVVEKDGTPVTGQSYEEFQEFCFGYQRKNQKGLEMCVKSDAQGPQNAKEAGRSWYYCYSGGLIDFGFPITVDGAQIGNWLGGQILLEAPDQEKFRQQAADIGIKDVEGYINALNKVPIVPEEKLNAAIDLLKIIASTFSQMGNELYLRKNLIDLVGKGKAEKLITSVRMILDDIRENELNILKAHQASASKAANITKTIIIGGSIFAILLALVIAVIIAKNVLSQLGGDPMVIERIARRISEGNLTISFPAARGRETGVFAAMKKMVETLREIIANMKTASANLAISSQELNSRSIEMAQGASEQAASAEEISAAMEEMVATIRLNAENAEITEKIAMKSANSATEGGKAADETVLAMKNISDKISIIQEIARQTNMLSLNAAIESAKAGELGKGFAVVAAEVRQLSKETDKSSKSIMDTTSASLEIAENAGALLSQMVPDIQKTADLVKEISVASKEQDSGAEQINSAIQQLDQIVQQNAALAEEISSVSEQLAAQARNLSKSAEFFEVEDAEPVSDQGGEDEALPDDIERIKALIAKLEDRIESNKGNAKKTSGEKEASREQGTKKSVTLNMNEIDDSEFEKY